MVTSHSDQVDARRVREQNQDERELGNKVDRRVTEIDGRKLETAGADDEAEQDKNRRRCEDGPLETARDQ